MRGILEKIKNLNLEKMLCFFLILCPILDIVSFGFRNIFCTQYSPSTFLRPIISVIVFLFVFFRSKKKWQIILVSVLYLVYAILHIYCFEIVKCGCSYGNCLSEMQYLVNYSFLIMNLFIYFIVFKDKDVKNLIKSMLIMLMIYVISIFIAILTGTSSATYEEGLGFKGWIESGNSLCTVMCVSLCVVLPFIKEKKYRIISIIVISLSGIFLTLLVGTRTGMFGFAIVLMVYVIGEVFLSIIKKAKVNKKIILIFIIVLLMLICVVALFGSKTLERRALIKLEQVRNVDDETGEILRLSGDLTKLKDQINNNEISEEYMSKDMQNAILKLYDYSVSTNMDNNDMRQIQLIYNVYLSQEQDNVLLKFFGNGFKSHFREVVMEMEVAAFWFNFGVVGFIIYFVPFLFIGLYGIYIALKYIKNLDIQFIMYLAGCWFAIALSFLSGYTFFNSSSMIVVIVANILLLSKIMEIKEQA